MVFRIFDKVVVISTLYFWVVFYEAFVVVVYIESFPRGVRWALRGVKVLVSVVECNFAEEDRQYR